MNVQETMENHPDSQHFVESATGWTNKGIHELADIIGSYPFDKTLHFGKIMSNDSVVTNGYTPEQLSTILHRFGMEMDNGTFSEQKNRYTKPHAELATLEAVRTMAGKDAKEVGGALDKRAEVLRAVVVARYTGTPAGSVQRTSASQEHPETIRKTDVVSRQIDTIRRDSFIQGLRSTAEQFKKKPGRALTVILGLALAACQQTARTPTPGTGETPPTGVPTLVTPEATVQPTPVPTESGFATEQPPTVFTQPTLTEAQYKEGSGGSGRTEIIAAGVDETVLRVYEQQAFAWLNTWLNANGLTLNDVTLRYISNGKAVDAYRWQVYFRRVSTNNIIWTAGQDTTYPTGIRIDDTPGPTYGNVTYDGTIGAQELPDTGTADVRFTGGGLPTVLSGQPVTIDGKQYYPLVRNPLTQEFVENVEVKTAFESAVANLYYPGVAPTIEEFDNHQVEQSQIKSIIADLRSKPSLLSPDAKPFQHSQSGYDTTTAVSLVCNYEGVNCAPAASISVLRDGTLLDIIIFEVLNADESRGYITGYFHDKVERNGAKSLERMLLGPTSNYAIIITQKTIDTTYGDRNPISFNLILQDGYVDFVEKIYQTGIIPREHEDKILVITF